MLNIIDSHIHVVEMHPRPEWAKLSENERKQWLHDKLATVNEFLQPDKSEGTWSTLAAGTARIIMIFTTMPEINRERMRAILRNAEASRYFVYDVITGDFAQSQDALLGPLLYLLHE